MVFLLSTTGLPLLSASGLVFIGTQAGSPPPEAPASGQFTRPTYSATPTLAEVERIYTDRRLTRPDWWVYGTTPKIVGTDTLPAGASYNAGTNRITISGTVTDLSGWDFQQTETTIVMSAGSRIDTFLHNKLSPLSIPKADRLSFQSGTISPDACITFATNSNASIGRMAYCWFTAGPTHEGGPFWPNAHISAQATNNTNFAGVDLAEWNSFEGYGLDANKTVRQGTWRFNFYDASFNIPEDAIEYVAGTYNQNDVVFSSANSHYLRICRNNGVTSAPNWSSKLAGTADWGALDPHSDQDQIAASPDGQLIEWYGNVSIRNETKRRYPSRQITRGIVNWLRGLVNNPGTQDNGKMWMHHNIVVDLVQANGFTSPGIEVESLADSYNNALNTKIIEDNWYQTDLTNATTGGHITVQNNISGWTFPAAATLSGLALDSNTAAATLAFQANGYGWMRVVFTTTQGTLTAMQIISASVGGAIKAVVETDADPNTAMLSVGAISGVSAGTTLYAYGLFQRGGGVDTLTGELSTVVVALPTTLAITEPAQSGMVYPEGTDGFADVQITLTGTANAHVEVKDYRTDTPSGYTWVGKLDGTGNLSTTFKATPQTGRLFSPQVRLRDNTAVSDTMTKKVGIGPNIGFESQSIIGNPLAQSDSGITVSGPGVIMESEVNDTILEFNGATSWARCSAKMANVFLALGNPKHAYGAWFFVYSGKSMLGLLSDGYDAARNFDPAAKKMTDRLAAHGTHLSNFLIFHGNADIINSSVADHNTIYTPAMIGMYATADGGGPVAAGATVSSPSRSFAAERVFLDASGTRTSSQVIADATKCKLTLVRHWQLPPSDFANTDLHFQGSNSQVQWESFEGIAARAVTEGMEAQAEGLVTYLTDSGFVHPAVTGTEGHEQVFVELALFALASEGEITITVPRITGVTWATDKATVQFDTALTTQNMTNAVDQAVTGFECNQGAGWYLAGITATIVGDGSTGQVEVVGTSAFASGDKLRYAAGGASGYWTPASQQAANRHRTVLRNPADAQLAFDHYGTAAASDGTVYTF